MYLRYWPFSIERYYVSIPSKCCEGIGVFLCLIVLGCWTLLARTLPEKMVLKFTVVLCKIILLQNDEGCFSQILYKKWYSVTCPNNI